MARSSFSGDGYLTTPEPPDAEDALRMAAYREVDVELMGRWPENRPGPSLDRIRAYTELAGHPEAAYKVVHVTGTNGKTSTVRMIDALLRTLGLRTGRFTSPHITEIRERIAVDGVPLSVDAFVGAFADASPFVEMVDERSDIRMTFFEVVTAMMFTALADAPVDVAILEVGLGGRWDATNVATADVAVIAPIDLDHTRLLGETAERIAREKAGIIKRGSVVVSAAQQPEVLAVLSEQAEAMGAQMFLAGRDFGVLDRSLALGGQMLRLQGLREVYDDVFLPLYGEHQATNASLALAAVEAFLGSGVGRAMEADLVREGFVDVDSPGRLEVLRTSPTIIIDAAHNPHGARAAAAGLAEAFDFDRIVGVIGVSSEKNATGLLDAFEPVLAEVVVTENSTDRTMPVAELAEIALEVFGEDRVHVEAWLPDAIELAVTRAEEGATSPGILVTGSVFTAGQARVLLTGSASATAPVPSPVVDSGFERGYDADDPETGPDDRSSDLWDGRVDDVGEESER
jgi:dihydrofolate synthase / folylpolyglutamate synthase